MDVWAYPIFKMSMLIAFAFGSILISMFPFIKRLSLGFAIYCLAAGCLIVILLLYFLFANPVIRDQILQYGFI